MRNETVLSDQEELPSWGVIAPLCLIVFAILVHGEAFGPFAVQIADDLDSTVPRIGRVTTLLLAAIGIAGLLVGPLADRFGHRRTILIGLLTVMLGAGAMAIASAYWMLLVTGLVVGVGATIMGVAFGVVASRYAGNAQRRALSRVQCAQTTGWILGAPLLTMVASFTNWRGAFVMVMVTYAITLPLILRSLKADAPMSADTSPFSLRATLDAYQPLLHNRRMVTLYSASALRSVGWFGPGLYLGAFYIQEHGLSIRQVGLVFMVFSIGLLAGNMADGRWLDGTDLNRVSGITSLMMSATYFLVFALGIPPLAIVGVTTLAAFCAGIGWVSLTTMLASESPVGPATTMTLNMSIFCFTGTASTALAGLLIALDGYRLIGIIFPYFVVASACLIWRPWVSIVTVPHRRMDDTVIEAETFSASIARTD